MNGTSLTSDNIQLSEVTQTEIEAASITLGELLEASLSASTRRAYRSDLADFVQWGGAVPSDASTLAAYLADRASRVSTITLQRRLIAIGKAHAMKGFDNPAKSELVRLAMRGIRRTYGTAQRQVRPATREDIYAMVSDLGCDLKSARDYALLLVGFAAALRRSELVALNCADIERVPQGLVIMIRRSKTDQEGAGRKVAVPRARGIHCPVGALGAWLSRSGITEGPVFRPVDRWDRIGDGRLSAEAVATVVKARAIRAGLDSGFYSGHSLRAGLVTSAARAGIPTWKIKRQTGHQSDAMLDRYIRDSQLFDDNAASVL